MLTLACLVTTLVAVSKTGHVLRHRATAATTDTGTGRLSLLITSYAIALGLGVHTLFAQGLLNLGHGAWLLQHLLAIVAGYTIQVFIVHNAHDRVRAARRSRWLAVAPISTGITVIALFAAVPGASDFELSAPGRYVSGGPANPVAAAAFCVVAFYLAASVVAVMIWSFQWAARAHGIRWLRFALTLHALGAFAVLLDCLHIWAYNLALLGGIVPWWPEAAVDNLLMPLGCTTLMVGLSTSTVTARLGRRRMRLWWRRYRARLRLRPLRLLLHQARCTNVRPSSSRDRTAGWGHLDPACSCSRPRSWLRDVLAIRHSDRRLYQVIIELWDLVRHVQETIAPAVHERAVALVDAHGCSESERSAVVQAATIVVGVEIWRAGDTRLTAAPATPAHSNVGDLDEAARWWWQVQHACTSSVVVHELLMEFRSGRFAADYQPATPTGSAG